MWDIWEVSVLSCDFFTNLKLFSKGNKVRLREMILPASRRKHSCLGEGQSPCCNGLSHNHKSMNSADNHNEPGRGPRGPAENHSVAQALTAPGKSEDLSELCLDSWPTITVKWGMYVVLSCCVRGDLLGINRKRMHKGFLTILSQMYVFPWGWCTHAFYSFTQVRYGEIYHVLHTVIVSSERWERYSSCLLGAWTMVEDKYHVDVQFTNYGKFYKGKTMG